MLTERELEIVEYIKNHGNISSKEAYDNISSNSSYATLKRDLAKLVSQNYIKTQGKGKGTKYFISPVFELVQPMNVEKYYEKEIDERETLQNNYKSNIAQLSDNEYKMELERLAIDLSWKSSQIEGNTYSLLETERLLKEKETASGKTKEEAVMLLNHKDALDFIIEHTNYLNPLSVSKIEDIHSILIKELAVEKNYEYLQF